MITAMRLTYESLRRRRVDKSIVFYSSLPDSTMIRKLTASMHINTGNFYVAAYIVYTLHSVPVL